MWLWLLAAIGMAVADEASAQPTPDELGAALATIGQWAMGLGGAGGAGAGGVSLYLWRDLRSRVEALETAQAALSQSIGDVTENVDEQRVILEQTRSAVAALGNPTESDQRLRERVAALEAQHGASIRHYETITDAIRDVRDDLRRAGGRRD